MGILFEAYYYLHSTDRDRNKYEQLFNDHKTTDAKQKAVILKRFAMPFAAHVASLALTRSRGKCNTPMFYISLVDDYFGLSNRGFVNRAACNTGLSLKAYKRLKKLKLESFQHSTEEAMRKG